MYSLGFADGRTGYVAVPQELVEHGDENVARMRASGKVGARFRQATSSL